MDVGVLLPTRDRLLDGAAQTGPLIEMAEQAEAVGLDSVWVGDSPLARPRHDALSMLSAVAVRTSRVWIGSAVLLAPLRHPLLVLHQAATVDLLSDGRFVLGLGAGFPLEQTRQQYDAVEADYARRGPRLEDTVGLARHVWGNSATTPFEGRTMHLDTLELEPRPHRPGGPPLWLAGGGPAGLRRVGELADGWLPYPPTPEQYAADLATIRGHAQRCGRATPSAAFYATVALDDDADRAHASAARYIERYYGLPLDLVGQVQAVYSGSTDGLVHWLTAYRDAGAEHVVVRFAGDIGPTTALEELANVRSALRADRVSGGVRRLAREDA
jgi:alkanesulfonate monooxygenase SsuD/methylene tetrahydromethanopterin reductase-like flavin-dependent oxidoreductase (luciferase family)